MKQKLYKILRFVIGGSLIGWIASILLGATAVGVLGLGIGGPAGAIFAVGLVVILFAVYGFWRMIRD